MALIESLRYIVTAETAGATANLNKLDTAAEGSMSSLDRLKAGFSQGLGAGAGFAALQVGVQTVERLGTALLDASKLAEQDARSQFTLSQAIGNNTAAGQLGVDSAERYVKALQQQAAVADDDLRPALATLVRSTNDVAKAQDLLGLSADVAAGTGRDVGSVADALAKAYQGNTKSLKALAPEVSRLIKDGASAEEIFAKLTTTYAGSAKGLADVSPWQRLNVQVEETKEQIGSGVLPLIGELADASKNAAPAVDLLASALAAEAAAAKQVTSPIGDVIDLLKQIPGVSALDGLGASGSSSGWVAQFAARREAFAAFSEQVQSGNQTIQYSVPLLGTIVPQALQNLTNKLFGVKPAAFDAGDGLDSLEVRAKAAATALGGVGDTMFGAERDQAAFNKSLEAGGSSAASSAKAYESALRRIDDSTRSLADAQRDLQETEIAHFLTTLGASSDEVSSAQIAERESTRSLANAKLTLIDAQQKLNDLQSGGAAASRLEAQAAVLDAQKALKEANGSGDVSAIDKAKAAAIRAQQQLNQTSSASQANQLAKAQSDVEAAADGVTKAAIDQRSAQKDLNDTLIRGKDGSKELRDADRELEDAHRKVEDAARNLTDAQGGLQDALSGTGSAAKSAGERFDDGVKSADAWIKFLADHQGTPEEFAAAIGAISSGLGSVATEAGKTGELDTYIQKIRDLSGLFLGLQGAQLPSSTTSSANAAEEALRRSAANQQQIGLVINIGGDKILDSILKANTAAGSPIVTTVGR